MDRETEKQKMARELLNEAGQILNHMEAERKLPLINLNESQRWKLAIDILQKIEMAETLKAMRKRFESFGKYDPIMPPGHGAQIDPDYPLEIKDPWGCTCQFREDGAVGTIQQYILLRDKKGGHGEFKLHGDIAEVVLGLECSKCNWQLDAAILMKRKERDNDNES